MNIVKPGNLQNKKGGFHFICEKCGCEWYADRGDKGFGISPPCCMFYAYMRCPTCNEEVVDEEHKTNIR